jgi:hypothetical protein
LGCSFGCCLLVEIKVAIEADPLLPGWIGLSGSYVFLFSSSHSTQSKDSASFTRKRAANLNTTQKIQSIKSSFPWLCIKFYSQIHADPKFPGIGCLSNPFIPVAWVSETLLTSLTSRKVVLSLPQRGTAMTSGESQSCTFLPSLNHRGLH